LENAAVLDIGCGCGILSITALLLGASEAMACDIDPGAARCALQNARLNNIDPTRFKVCTGDIFQDDFILGDKKIDEDGNNRYDIVMAL
jgi:ribosomal protein L11 methyltransferase